MSTSARSFSNRLKHLVNQARLASVKQITLDNFQQRFTYYLLVINTIGFQNNKMIVDKPSC